MEIEEKCFADNSCNDNVTNIITKEKVADGKLFFAIDGAGNICPIIQSEHNNSDLLNNIGNYFYTSKEAETMAKKLRAVLNGAEVIEMPSDEEISKENFSSAHKMDIDDGETPNSGLYNIGWGNAVEWLKSKIIEA